MKTSLIEFKNPRNNTLRGVLVSVDDQKDHVVVMLGGFERQASTERKFKLLSDELTKQNIDSFRFDVADVGLSDGDFYQMTTQTMADDLMAAIELVKGLGYRKISFAGHSHASCNLSLVLNKVEFEKILLIAPALNQRDIWRFWFAQEKNPNDKIDWHNYKENFDEAEFEKTLTQDFYSKNHILGPKLKQINVNIDYSVNFADYDLNRVLVVHGDSDPVCPIESLTIDFPNKIVVKNGDHDVDKPEIISQWLSQATSFLVK